MFWQLLKESVIVQALLTVGIWAAIITMVLSGRVVPDVLTNSGYAVLGFYFGSKLAMARQEVHVMADRRQPSGSLGGDNGD